MMRRLARTTTTRATVVTSASLVASSLLAGGCALTIDEADFLQRERTVWPVRSIDPSFRRTVVEVTQSDGNVSRGIRLASPNARGTVLFFQGNGETVDREGALRLWQFERLNLNAVIFDRRGSGQTPGQPTIARLGADAVEQFDQIRSAAGGPLIVHGFSLGTSIAGIVARDRPVDALVLEGATPTVAAYLDVHLPWFVKAFARPSVAPELAATDTAAALRDYRGPLLIAVGERDGDTVPELSRRLFAALGDDRKELAIVPGAGHQALTTPSGLDAYAAFLRRAMPSVGP